MFSHKFATASLITFLLLCSVDLACAQENESLATPRDSMSYFLAAMKAYKMGDQNAIKNAAKTFDLSEINPLEKDITGIIVAKKLINSLDRMESIDINRIPKAPKQDIWYYKKEKIPYLGLPMPVEVAIHKMANGNWLFTPKTLISAPIYESYLKDQKVAAGVTPLDTMNSKILDHLPGWALKKGPFMTYAQWLLLMFLLLTSYVLQKTIRIVSGVFTRKFLHQRNIFGLDKKMEKRLTLAIGMLVFAFCFSLGLNYIELPLKVIGICLRMTRILFTLGVVMVLYQLSGVASLFMQKYAEATENKFDNIVVPLVRKSVKTMIFCLGSIFIGEAMGIDMHNILAGLGIGGLAFAFASKDTLANLFGGLGVLIDHPFRLGDWIKIGGMIEGEVEDVGLRCTRIRTADNSLITVPNGQLSNIHIDNFGLREYRRYKTLIGVEYDTPPEKIESFCEGIRAIIAGHPATRKDSFHVYLSEMGASALEITLIVHWKARNLAAELSQKHRLLVDIIRLAREMKINFAFPTQTLHVLQAQQQEHESWSTPHFADANKMAQQISNNPISPIEARSSTPLTPLE